MTNGQATWATEAEARVRWLTDVGAIHPDIALANRYGIPADIHLVSCGMTKAATAAPAAELYTGSTFQRAVAFASSRAGMAGQGPAPCYIVSALHGLLPLDRTIEPYDRTIKDMNRQEVKAWAATVADQLSWQGVVRANFHVHAGARYMIALKDALSPYGPVVNFFNPWGDGAPGIGDRRGFYRRTHEAETAWREQLAAA